MKVLVTGGAGFIGSHITDMMLNAGHTVAVIDDLSTGRRENLPDGVDFVQADIRGRAAFDFVRDFSPEIIAHAAAQISVSKSMEEPVTDTEINLVGLVNLLQSLHGHKLPYFVFLSTGGALYGEQEEFPASEGHSIKPASVYGMAKYASELYLDLWSREFGLKYAALRLANVYGPRQNPHGEAGVVAIFANRLLNGGEPVIFGDGEQTRDFVFVEDVARAVSLVCQQQIAGAYNIGTGVETDVNTIYAHIAGSLGKETVPRYESQRPGEQRRSCINYRLAKETFGWEAQIDIAEGIRRTCEWFKAQS